VAQSDGQKLNEPFKDSTLRPFVDRSIVSEMALSNAFRPVSHVLLETLFPAMYLDESSWLLLRREI